MNRIVKAALTSLALLTGLCVILIFCAAFLYSLFYIASAGGAGLAVGALLVSIFVLLFVMVYKEI